ncbi:MAG: hypothetical protein M1355_03430 [Patescibacteria group bacterium]|nr:hypothetical protein [Patescibacteria group bacterium]
MEIKVLKYKCEDCKAEFESLGEKEVCLACGKKNIKKTGERELTQEDFGSCGRGCAGCQGCQ